MAAVASGIGASAPSAGAQSYQPPFVFLSGSETAVVDVTSFASRADRWNDAQTRHRDDAIKRAEALAAMQRRVEAQEAQEAETEEAAVPEPAPPAAPAPPPATSAAPAPPATSAPPPVTAAPALAVGGGFDGDIAGDEEFGLLPPADGPSPEQWLAMRHCESRHQYRVVSPSGAYRGAWQFSRRTWNWVAEKRGHDHLVGVDPIDASPAEQDLMAYELYDMDGPGHWPVCGKHLH